MKTKLVCGRLQIESAYSMKSDDSSDLVWRPVNLHWSCSVAVVHPVYLKVFKNVFSFKNTKEIPLCFLTFGEL